MLESGAVPSQDGAGRGPDGEGLAAAPDEKPESQHQLEAARPPHTLSPPLYTWPRKPAQAPPTGNHQSWESRHGRPMKGDKTETPPPHPAPILANIHLLNEPPCDCKIRNNSMKQCRDCLKITFLMPVLCSLVEIQYFWSAGSKKRTFSGKNVVFL